jgi:hypothetical protein
MQEVGGIMMKEEIIFMLEKKEDGKTQLRISLSQIEYFIKSKGFDLFLFLRNGKEIFGHDIVILED